MAKNDAPRMSVARRCGLNRACRSPARMAPKNRSGGSSDSRAGGGRHHTSAAITPAVATALIQNGAARLQTPMMTPASAGPTARLTLKPTLLRATACCKSGLGTSCDTIDCHVGAMSAAQTPSRNASSNRLAGVTRSSHTNTPNKVARSTVAAWVPIRSLRRSTMSASAPAGSAKMNMGSAAATCTSATTSGSGLRWVINQAAAAHCIQVPMFETTVAIHSTVNAGCRNGLRGDVVTSGCGSLLSPGV